MVNEKYLLSKLFEIRRTEQAIRQEFDSEIELLIKNHLQAKPTSEIMPELNKQRKMKMEMLEKTYGRYLDLKEEAEISAPQLVEAIVTLADQLGCEIERYRGI